MKKCLIGVSALLAVTSCFAQGLALFSNTSTTRVSTNSVPLGPATGLISGPVGNWYFALFVAPSTQNTVDYSLSGWTYVGTGTNTATAGRFNGNVTSDPGIPVPGYAIGSTADFVIIGWSANLSYDVNAARSFWNNGGALTGNFGSAPATWDGGPAFFGISVVAQNQILGGGGQPVPNLFAATLIPNMTLAVLIPEPGTFAMLAVGLLGICYRRGRKSLQTSRANH